MEVSRRRGGSATGTYESPKVRVRSDPGAALVGRSFYDSRFAPTGCVCCVKFGEAALRKPELALEYIEHRIVDCHRFAHEGHDRVVHVGVDGRGVRAMIRAGPGKRIVLCNVEELDGVPRAVEICGDGSSRLVSAFQVSMMGATDEKPGEWLTRTNRRCRLVRRASFPTTGAREFPHRRRTWHRLHSRRRGDSNWRSKRSVSVVSGVWNAGDRDSLPESEVSSRVPKFGYFVPITSFQETVIDDDEWMSGYGRGEGGEGGEPRHCVEQCGTED